MAETGQPPDSSSLNRQDESCGGACAAVNSAGQLHSARSPPTDFAGRLSSATSKPAPTINTHLPTPSPPSIPSSAPPVPALPTILGGHSDDELSSDTASTSPSKVNGGRVSKPHSVSEPASAPDKKQEVAAKAQNRSRSVSSSKTQNHDHVRRLSAAGMQQLASEPESLPIAVVPEDQAVPAEQDRTPRLSLKEQLRSIRQQVLQQPDLVESSPLVDGTRLSRSSEKWHKSTSSRTLSTPPGNRRAHHQTQSSSPRRNSFNPSARHPPRHINLNGHAHFALPQSRARFPSQAPAQEAPLPSPLPPSIPLPPMSIPTHLQLELSTQRPSPLYIHQSHANEIPYESMAVKIERLINVLVMPIHLERALYFGALACLDAWLYNFTILPMRFCLALGVLLRWWLHVINKEVRWVTGYVWAGVGRLWTRGRRGSMAQASRTEGDDTSSENTRGRSQSNIKQRQPSQDHLNPTKDTPSRDRGPAIHLTPDSKWDGNGHAETATSHSADRQYHQQQHHHHEQNRLRSAKGAFRHRRTKSMPSNLTSMHKADLLQGAVIIFSSAFLMNLDASRMYHVIRGQDAIKLYVIYNVLEVGDRLLSALGQDIFECLFSAESLSRNQSGRSKVLLPFGLFILALIYNCIHSVTLYYQVIALNVAVNSYSNALLTLLLSNQFVEVKSTVFKRFEKDNLFQLTCADITERFQLWLMLFIIGMRNVVEVGGLSIPGANGLGDAGGSSTKPLHSPFILPHSFTVLPSWLWSGEVLSPFLIVIGSEMLVDTIKHAYVNKFNRIKPKFYSRILDILCKDYYTNAFSAPALTRRVGLSVLPLACLFIRSSIQTYHMFLSTHVPAPMPQSTQTSLMSESATPSSPAMLAALDRLDTLLRDALGRAVYSSSSAGSKTHSWFSWSTDDLVAAVTMLVFFFIAFLALLIVKILLGMALLRYSRNRYAAMKEKEHLVSAGQAEHESYDASGKRLGGYGQVEVSEDKRRWIHADKDEGLKGKGRPEKGDKPPEGSYQGVQRFEMIAKRIW